MKLNDFIFIHLFYFFRMDVDSMLKPFDDEQKHLRKFYSNQGELVVEDIHVLEEDEIES